MTTENLSFAQSIQNPEWVAAHITELREVFPVTTDNPVHFQDIVVMSAKLSRLGIDPQEFGDNFMAFVSEVFEPLKKHGVINLEYPSGMGRGLYVTRKRPEAFEMAATDRQTEELLSQEPSEESRALANEAMARMLGGKPKGQL